MWDVSVIITRIISEHHAIRGHIKLAGDTVNDIEALFTLERTQSRWSHTSVTALIEERDRLLQSINSLEEGLRNHFSFEEEALPSLFGDLLIKALLQEHHEISRQIADAKATLSSIELEGLDQRELFSKKALIQQKVDNLSWTIEQHAQHEEAILNLVKGAVQENTK